MPHTDFGSIGTDVSLDVFDPADGTFTTIKGLTSFTATPMTTDLEHHGLDGKDSFATLYRGWELRFDYDRKDGQLDRIFASREARYRARQALQSFTVTQTIAEADGSVTQYRFSNVELKQDNPGNYTREDKVSGSITGRGMRTKVA